MTEPEPKGWFAVRRNYARTHTWDFLRYTLLTFTAGVVFVAAGWLVFLIIGDFIVAALLVATGYITLIIAFLVLVLSFMQGPPDRRRYVPRR